LCLRPRHYQARKQGKKDHLAAIFHGKFVLAEERKFGGKIDVCTKGRYRKRPLNWSEWFINNRLDQLNQKNGRSNQKPSGVFA
jgi:hypothetical protein